MVKKKFANYFVQKKSGEESMNEKTELIHAGMVLEGGAMRGVFTAGVLDCLMEKGMYCQYVVGVSAGSCNAVDYVSKQIGRTKACFIPKEKENRSLSIFNLLKGKDLYDMNKAFIDIPAEIYPFDFKTFFESKVECEIVTTNCLTGQAEYMSETRQRARLMDLCRASSSLPLVSPIVMLEEGIPYLDGGLTDSVPILRSLSKGYQKNIIVLTRNKGYRKENSTKMLKLYQRIYKKYPALVQALETRAIQYNQTMELIETMERDGSAFVLRPNIKCVSRMEQNQTKLNRFYQHGYQQMKNQEKRLEEYLAR